MMPELDNERQIVGSQPQDTELRPDRTTLPESLRLLLGMYSLAVRAADRIDELEELLRLVHVDVVRASGVLADLDEKIAAALNWNKGAGPGPPA
jgi:hypothetical protein